MERTGAAVWRTCQLLVMPLLLFLTLNFALERTLNHEDSELRLRILNIQAQITMACKHLPRSVPFQLGQ